MGVRVPTQGVSILDISLAFFDKIALEEIRHYLFQIQDQWLQLDDTFRVSSDFIQDEAIATINLHSLHLSHDRKMVKMQVWHDNEWGYIKSLVGLMNTIKETL
jgi:glyceraldehyde-3-phosphate dehydrogenase/erythrose-4-phosphate dehydrogenase